MNVVALFSFSNKDLSIEGILKTFFEGERILA
jgi:hypothetical protein